ncbi:hypothetical protein NB713_002998 [Xanthomonas sacchari]|nr:hypothetical protein [Xanthomonas sacchari]
MPAPSVRAAICARPRPRSPAARHPTAPATRRGSGSRPAPASRQPHVRAARCGPDPTDCRRASRRWAGSPRARAALHPALPGPPRSSPAQVRAAPPPGTRRSRRSVAATPANSMETGHRAAGPHRRAPTASAAPRWPGHRRPTAPSPRPRCRRRTPWLPRARVGLRSARATHRRTASTALSHRRAPPAPRSVHGAGAVPCWRCPDSARRAAARTPPPRHRGRPGRRRKPNRQGGARRS